jgi:hypothetical protein
MAVTKRGFPITRLSQFASRNRQRHVLARGLPDWPFAILPLRLFLQGLVCQVSRVGKGAREGTAGDHKGPPSHSTPPSPLQVGDPASKNLPV